MTLLDQEECDKSSKRDNDKDLEVLLVSESGSNHMERDWLEKLKINLSTTCNDSKWTDLEGEYSELFKLSLRTLYGRNV